MKLTPHEKKVLKLINENPNIIKDPSERKKIAEKYGFSEKTLRNRIGDLKKYGLISKEIIGDASNRANNHEANDLFHIFNILLSNRANIFKNLFLVLIFSMILVFIIPKTYTSSAILMPPTSDSGSLGNMMGALSTLPFGGLGPTTNDESLSIVAILKSRTLSEKVIEKFNLIDFYEVTNIDKALMALSKDTRFEILEEGTINISVSLKTGWFHTDESEAKIKSLCSDMALFFVTELDILNKSLKTEQASFHRKFIEQRYKENLVDLKNAEDSLRHFQEKHKMIALTEQTSAAIEAAAAIKAQMLSNEVKLGVMLGSLNSNHPDIENVKIENIELNKKMNEIEYGGGFIGVEKSNLFPVLSNVPELGVELIRLKREVEIQNTLFVFLTQQYEEAKIKEAKDTPTVQVLDYPKEPYQKSAPKRKNILFICLFISTFTNILYILYRSELKI